MSKFTDKLEDRLQTQRAAKQAMLARIAARPSADDPVMMQKKAERQAILAAREVRRAQAEIQKKAQAEVLREKALADARLAEEQKEQDARDAILAAEREAELKIQQKAARDARYAARKARR